MKTLIFPALLCLGGCATIVGGGSNQLVSVRSVPTGAHVVVTDHAGTQIYEGTTPFAATLKRGDGYFKRQSYTLSATLAGHEPATTSISPNVNPWYFGNLFLGGVIGMLIVDPATGAMYRFDDSTSLVLPALPELSAADNDKAQ